MSDNEFYKFFDKVSDDGYVCTSDMSSLQVQPTKLHTDEIAERGEWNKAFDKIYRYYLKSDKYPQVSSREELLQQRLIAPKLSTVNITTRTKGSEPRAGRLYPPPLQLRTWDNLVRNVNNYQVKEPKSKVLSAAFRVFLDMLVSGNDERRSEDGEEAHLLKGLHYLVAAKIVSNIHKRHGSVGQPDFLLTKNTNKISVIAESKSTHNLLMPAEAKEVVRKYKRAYSSVLVNGGSQTTEWSHIAHPLARLLGYLVDNKRRYGALTSATRTYFVFVSDNGAATKVHVSEPYYVGEVNYLRAWAFVHSLGSAQTDIYQVPTSGQGKWLRTNEKNPTPQPSKTARTTKKRKRGSGSGQKSSPASKAPKANSASLRLLLPQVDFHDLIVGEALGVGKNGSVFKVEWKGAEYAMKQFDLRKDNGEARFEKELAAYVRARKAWGTLVPEPFFLSETPSGGVMLLGLQLGKPIKHNDPNMKELSHQWKTALDTLESEYDIRHNDTDGRNAIVVKGNRERDQVVVIDFEDWDDLRCPELHANPE